MSPSGLIICSRRSGFRHQRPLLRTGRMYGGGVSASELRPGSPQEASPHTRRMRERGLEARMARAADIPAAPAPMITWCTEGGNLTVDICGCSFDASGAAFLLLLSTGGDAALLQQITKQYNRFSKRKPTGTLKWMKCLKVTSIPGEFGRQLGKPQMP